MLLQHFTLRHVTHWSTMPTIPSPRMMTISPRIMTLLNVRTFATEATLARPAMATTTTTTTTTTRVQPLASAVAVNLQNLQPVDGSHINRKRVGRGGQRGGTSGRGQGGQKHHAKRPAPWFTGLYTNPIIEAIPRFAWAPRNLKPHYVPLNVERVQRWIDLGRLDATRVITMREMVRSRLVHGPLKDGVKLLAGGSSALRTPNIRLEVSRASHTAIHAVERAGGTVTTVYHTRRGLDTLLHPERHDLIAPYERPVLERDVEYYTDARNRGYLADRTRFEREFLPRGYLGTEEDERVLAGDLRMHQARVRYVVPGMDMEARVRALHEERQRLEEEAEREAKERRMQEEERERAWRDGRWFAAQQQGEWRWVEVDAKSGEVRANFKISAQA